MLAIGVGNSPVFNTGGRSGLQSINSPLELINNVLWLDGDDADTFTFSSGVLVSQWADKGPNTDHVVQADTGKQPDYNASERRVQFDGQDEFLRSDGAWTPGDLSDVTILIVAQVVEPNFAPATIDTVIDGATKGNFFFMRPDLTPSTAMIAGSSAAIVDGPYNTNTHIYAIHFNSSGNDKFWKAGGKEGEGEVGNFDFDGVTLGATSASGSFFTGNIYEVIVYSDLKSDDDLNLVGNYLSTKWDLSWVPIGSGLNPNIPKKKARHHAGNGVIQVSGKVSEWIYSSGNENNFIQLTASKRPIFSGSDSDFNDLPVIIFDGTDDEMVTAVLKGGSQEQPNTVFLVARWDALASGRHMFDGIVAGKRHGYRNSNDNHALVIDIVREYETADATDAHIIVLEFNDASSKIIVDGGSSSSFDPGDDDITGFVLGNNFESTAAGTCTVAELVVYDSLVSFTDQDTIGNELATRYGLSWTARS